MTKTKCTSPGKIPVYVHSEIFPLQQSCCLLPGALGRKVCNCLVTGNRKTFSEMPRPSSTVNAGDYDTPWTSISVASYGRKNKTYANASIICQYRRRFLHKEPQNL